ncbi:MAG: hypothetical protein C0606_00545 [Hyphomicrobiales bacterium]|nr:MAG: hypothetical protein C0606_00545 [Hyphomicrobiales bacterium]
MSDTTHLTLPYILASQAQKHVTHNEALLLLDALVQLSVVDKNRTEPPSSPQEGDRHIIATSATGDWAGHDNSVAIYDDGVWTIRAPNPGWFAWVEADGEFAVWRGDAWIAVDTYVPDDPVFDSLGVNTAPDATNKLAVKSNAVLFAPVEAGDGGTGDVRFVVDKEAAGDTASLLFQTGWSGRAELGIEGDDTFRLKVSADGTSWVEALEADAATGVVRMAAGAEVAAINGGPLAGFRNYLINGDFRINQRTFAGGALAAGEYGHDRWRASAGGASLSVSGGVVTLTSGAIEQVIEAPGLAGATITVSVENPTAAIAVDVDGVTGTIAAGSGRRGVTLTVPTGSTGDVTLKLSVSAETMFARAQFERGPHATPFEWRPEAIEWPLVQRYYVQGLPFGEAGYAAEAGATYCVLTSVVYPSRMRVAPAISLDLAFSAGIDGSTLEAHVIYAGGCFIRAAATAAGRTYVRGAITADAEL